MSDYPSNEDFDIFLRNQVMVNLYMLRMLSKVSYPIGTDTSEIKEMARQALELNSNLIKMVEKLEKEMDKNQAESDEL